LIVPWVSISIINSLTSLKTLFFEFNTTIAIVLVFPIVFAYFKTRSFLKNGIFLFFLLILLEYKRYMFSIFLPGLYLINGNFSVLFNNLNIDSLFITSGVHRFEFNKKNELMNLLKKYKVSSKYFQEMLIW